eukprot:486982-Amphidinium_carterae.1
MSGSSTVPLLQSHARSPPSMQPGSALQPVLPVQNLAQSSVARETPKLRGGAAPLAPPLNLTFAQASADPLAFRLWVKKVQAWEKRVVHWSPPEEHALILLDSVRGCSWGCGTHTTRGICRSLTCI